MRVGLVCSPPGADSACSDDGCSPLLAQWPGAPPQRGMDVCLPGRWGGQRALPVSAVPQLSSAQNNPNAKVASLGMACSVILYPGSPSHGLVQSIFPSLGDTITTSVTKVFSASSDIYIHSLTVPSPCSLLRGLLFNILFMRLAHNVAGYYFTGHW